MEKKVIQVIQVIQRYIKAMDTGDIELLKSVLHTTYVNCHGDLLRPDQPQRKDKASDTNPMRWRWAHGAVRKFSLLQLDILGSVALGKIWLESEPVTMLLIVLVKEKEQWFVIGHYPDPRPSVPLPPH
ncbi:nuclear transport factor 2 family protein [Muricauda sp. NFXS6]|uniref:hypothetical protein n=1 Tax=Allomuricauda sp. NFXS6 TaxID=2819094 RepID=UPI0032DF9ECB